MFNLNTPQMYKVFFNECLIRLTPKINNSRSGNIGNVVDIQNISRLFGLLKLIENRKHAEQPVLNCSIGVDLMAEVLSTMTQLPAAGGVVRNPAGGILFIRRFGRWDLPKGKIEPGESAERTAVREVEEECGIRGVSLLRKITSTYHIYRSPYLPDTNNWVWKETFWFEMQYTGHAEPIGQVEEDITAVRWFTADQLDEVFESTYGNLRDLLNDYLA